MSGVDVPPPTHYAVLGLAPDADHDTIRRAWIRAARESHPDRLAGVPDHEPDAADEDRIRAVNEAWRVLSDTHLRRDYDRSLRKASPPAPRVAGADGLHPFPDAPDGDVSPDVDHGGGFEVANPGVATLLRALPWLVVGAIGLGIFVFTAFAAGGRDEQPAESVLAPDCVRIRDNGTVQPVPCDWENDGVVDQFLPLDSDRACRHEHAVPHDAPVHNARVCLVPYELYDG